MATLSKQKFYKESQINKWGWMEDCWDKLVRASEQGGWDRPDPPALIRVVVVINIHSMASFEFFVTVWATLICRVAT